MAWSGRNPPWTRAAELLQRNPLQAKEPTLANWRKLANDMAKRVGGEWACGMCYRPCKGRWAKVSWGTWGRQSHRKLCYSCFILIEAFILGESSKQRWDSQLPVLDMGGK